MSNDRAEIGFVVAACLVAAVAVALPVVAGAGVGNGGANAGDAAANGTVGVALDVPTDTAATIFTHPERPMP